MEINEELRAYIEDNIFPRYKKNDKGHGIEHILYVINRSIKFANANCDVNTNMVYTIAAYHDIGHSIDAKKHELISAQILLEDKKLRKFFNEEEIKIMSDAIEDHRASIKYEPRSIYGKIVSSADRNTDIGDIIKRTYEYCTTHNKGLTLKQILDTSYQHIVDKFGYKGYANEKMYFEDLEYKKFLEEVNRLLKERNKFNNYYIKINNLK